MKTAIALGTFDGLHTAHRQVLSLPDGYKKVAVTFKKPPKMVILGQNELLLTEDQKYEYLKEFGIDEVITLDFSKVRNDTPESFFKYLKDELGADFIACGFNYRFGKNGAGDTALLSEFCKESQVELRVSNSFLLPDGTPLSSSYIRSLLKGGQVTQANRFLFKPFCFTAPVQKGDQRGRTIGFPTINQKYPADLVKLRFGVYKTRVLVDGKSYEAITDIGIRPTYETDFVISETFIKDFSGDLYGKEITVIPVEFLRDEKKFSNIKELKKQIELDLIN
ncbi:MAG: riboflavin biosynthesis protein RibF [Clostridia bacterium]|nr:riboflavin biosynthesis protein RibF [Clostridia bacterium]